MQLVIDLCGYLLWLLYAHVPQNVVKEMNTIRNSEDENQQNYGKCNNVWVHFVFLILAIFAIFWLILSKFYEDFTFEQIEFVKTDTDDAIIFGQIVSETLLLIEVAHNIIERMVCW